MNFIFCDQRHDIPKYAAGSNPYTINVAKILSASSSSDYIDRQSYVFALNMMLIDEFLFASKNKKSAIIYINKEITPQLIKTIKKTLKSNKIDVKKYFARVSNDIPGIKSLVETVFIKNEKNTRAR